MLNPQALSLFAHAEQLTIDQGIELVKGYLLHVKGVQVQIRIRKTIDGNILNDREKELFEHAVTVASNFFKQLFSQTHGTFNVVFTM